MKVTLEKWGRDKISSLFYYYKIIFGGGQNWLMKTDITTASEQCYSKWYLFRGGFVYASVNKKNSQAHWAHPKSSSSDLAAISFAAVARARLASFACKPPPLEEEERRMHVPSTRTHRLTTARTTVITAPAHHARCHIRCLHSWTRHHLTRAT